MQITMMAAEWAVEDAKVDAAYAQLHAAEKNSPDSARLDAALSEQIGRADRLAEAIAEVPSANVSEAAIKLRVTLKHCSDGLGGFTHTDPIFACLADLEQLARREGIAAARETMSANRSATQPATLTRQ
ncbi:MAG: hypothetical protein Q8S03_04900 [Brevundimonas sp.]|uniref:hypothetical protein n=1 Tax=Brevundimonas sp. TaxID=1871086 RepID=UPI0027356776|nr:hypothetical protein [Brevundimonas sp.]MDP3404008.1 hypothetical protein [Brevundimonas sp.]